MTSVRRASPGDAAVLGRMLWDFNTEFETEMHKVVQGVLSNQTQPSAAMDSLAQTAETLKKKYS